MICDYEGSDYKARFWQNADRAYEDAVERVALRRLLPSRGGRIVEFGAGFGRLADLYTGYDEIILLDYSRTLLEQAMARWGDDPRFKFVAANLHHLPFVDSIMDAATMVRVIHHISDVPAALAEIRRVMAPTGVFVMEFANKRNLKSIARYAARRQPWSPFDQRPVEFARLNFDFHPAWMIQQLRQAGFATQRRLAVSYLRAGFLKRVVPVQWMVFADAILQRTAGLGVWSPSVFTRNGCQDTQHRTQSTEHRTQNTEHRTQSTEHRTQDTEHRAQNTEHRRGDSAAGADGDSFVDLLRSPRSGAPLRREGDVLVCDADGTRWHARGNFFDLKEELAVSRP